MADSSMTVGTNAAELDFDPAFTTAEAQQIEAANSATSQARELALSLLTKTKGDLMKLVQSDPEAAMDMVDMLSWGMQRNDMIQEQLQAAFARLSAAASKELGFDLF